MIIITIEYPAREDRPARTRDFTIVHFGDNIHNYVTKKLSEGRITHVIVKNNDTVVWDSDKEWF